MDNGFVLGAPSAIVHTDMGTGGEMGKPCPHCPPNPREPRSRNHFPATSTTTNKVPLPTPTEFVSGDIDFLHKSFNHFMIARFHVFGLPFQ
jgi:hypothetical protein